MDRWDPVVGVDLRRTGGWAETVGPHSRGDDAARLRWSEGALTRALTLTLTA